MPTLFVLGGANGAGKTTWYSAGIVNSFINEGLPFIHPDNIVLLELGGIPQKIYPGQSSFPGKGWVF